MAIAIALVLIVLGSVIFHFWSPWTMTELASNWGTIDDTIVITLIITGIVFIAINLFVAFAVIKFRHKEGRRAKYEPENKKLELWLTVITSIGIIAMLAPGLVVYSDFVEVPEDAMEVEVMGQQWSWSFRFPGKDGQMGQSAIEYISIDNPFGLDPLDTHGQDDVLISANRVTLPQDVPVKLLLRSKDVLHDFYVPQFRVKMDMVPGIVSYMWFTPTVEGEYEILCAEFCGVGHFNMRGHVDVVSPSTFDNWLNNQPTFASTQALNRSEVLSLSAQAGADVAQTNGCLACHNFEANSVGPTWKGLYGKTRNFTDGSQGVVDEAYLTQSILQPNAKIVAGYAPIMPAYSLTELELEAVIAYIREKGGDYDSAVANTDLSTVAVDNTGAVEQEGDALTTESGSQLFQTKGCVACHSIDGTERLGPSWLGLYNAERLLTTGQTVVADEEYLMEAIFQPNATIVEGYQPVMPPPVLNPNEAQAIIDYIKTLSESDAKV